MALGNICEPSVFLSAPPIRGRSRFYFKKFDPNVVNGVFSASMRSFFKRFSDFISPRQAASYPYVSLLRAGKNPPWRDPKEPADLYQIHQAGFCYG